MGLTGFGFGLIAMGAFPFLMSVAEANAIVLVLAFVVCVIGVVPVRRSIRFDVLWPVFIGSAVGVPLGVIYLVELNETVLRISLGVVLLLALAGEFIGRRRPRTAGTVMLASGTGARLAGVGIGVLSGAFGGAFSVGGPPIVLYLNGQLEEKTQIKASLLLFFIVNVSFRAPLFALSGVITVETLLLSLWALPTLIVGLAAGSMLHNRLDSGIVRRMIQILLVVSAAMMILNAV